MTDGSLLSLGPAYRPPAVPPADPQAGQRPKEAFSDLLGPDKALRARRAAAPAMQPLQADAGSGAETASDRSTDDATASEAAPEKKDKRLPPPDESREKGEGAAAWVGGLQATASPPLSQRLPKHEGDAGETPEAGSAGAGMAPEAAGEGLDQKLKLASLALRQKLRDAGRVNAPDSNATEGGAAVAVEASGASGETGEHSAISRRSRAAVASLALGHGVHANDAEPVKKDAEPGRAKPRDAASAAKAASEKPSPAPDLAETGQASSADNASPLGGLPRQSVAPKAFAALLASSVDPANAAAGAAVPANLKDALPQAQMRVLEVRLHPAELGSVTARLRVTDGQLSVEITTDSLGGKDSLAAQEGAIRTSLEALGFRVDRLTIQHGGASGSAEQNSAGNAFGGQAEGRGFAGASDTGAGNAGRNGQGTSGKGDGDAEGSAPVAATLLVRPGLGASALFI